ncbi:putative methyltransferase [Trypanosoma grayi]|uniref:putative methyltransferase n=1 Tax=Trypanosoma grayi TaxID=71804 RepID=UPI0004F492FA|nr:putative methyltransferase [Trypanosoma grayi]KEG14289.1 putative methyltransferase [Trypanosoma grayi]
MEYLDRCYQEGFVDNDTIPLIMPTAWVLEDETFKGDIAEMNDAIASSQVSGLKMVLTKMQSTPPAAGTEVQPMD